MTAAPFSDAEYRDRLARARRAMADLGVDVCVCVAPELLYYFTGYEAHTHFSAQALVIGADAATFVHRDVDSGNAQDSCRLDDRRTYHHGGTPAAEVIAAVCREHGGARPRVGVCFDAYALTGAFARALTAHLAPLEVVDASAPVERVRLVKSPAELECIRAAGRMAEAGLRRAREAARPGMTDIALAGHVEAAMREAGSEYPAMPAWISSGARTRGGHRTPVGRAIEAGERLKLEFAASHRRYHAVTMQTLWVGGEPGPGGRRAYEAAAEALRAGEAAIAIGRPVADSESAAFAVLEAAGFDVRTHSRFGYGVGIAYPPTWLEGALDITRESEQRFEAGMSFVLHTAVVDPEEHQGLLVGGAYVLDEGGLECLSGGALPLATVG